MSFELGQNNNENVSLIVCLLFGRVYLVGLTGSLVGYVFCAHAVSEGYFRVDSKRVHPKTNAKLS